MSGVSIAEELRAAARIVRETAEGTTPTPWRVHLRYYRKSPDMLAGAEFETPLHTSGISLNRPHLLADTRWKALMSPAVVEPLVTWLEDEAAYAEKGFVRDAPECPGCGDGCGGHDEMDFHDGTEDRAGCERPLNGSDGNRCACFTHALAVARAITGRTA